MKMNCEKKLLLVRVLLTLALLVGMLSAFQNWELLENDYVFVGGEPIRRSYSRVVRAIEIGLLHEYNGLFQPSHGSLSGSLSIHVLIPILHYALNFSLFLFLLTPILLARTFSRSRILWWLWLVSYVSWHALLSYIYQKYAPDVFVTSIRAGSLGYQTHISWLSGFYFGCSAAVLHLLGMIFLLFSSPPTRKNT